MTRRYQTFFMGAVTAATFTLASCGFFGEGDNAPTIFDSDDERAARSERRAESPAVAINGEMYRIIDATIDGKITTPDPQNIVVLTLSEGQIKGTDGCSTWKGTGIFTPSGYEYTTLDSDPFKIVKLDCDKGVPFDPIYELHDRVWALDITPEGILVLTEYDTGNITFRLKPRRAE